MKTLIREVAYVSRAGNLSDADIARATGAAPSTARAIEVSLERVADLSDEDRLRSVELARPRPGRSDSPAYQQVGETLHVEAWPALVAPSAARPEGAVICVFRTSGEIPGLVPLPPPSVQAEPPALPRGLRT